MVLVNGGFLLAQYRHKEILVNSSLKATKKKKKLARAISKNQVSNPGPSWPSCFLCPCIERSGAYCLSICPSVCLHKPNMKT